MESTAGYFKILEYTLNEQFFLFRGFNNANNYGSTKIITELIK